MTERVTLIYGGEQITLDVPDGATDQQIRDFLDSQPKQTRQERYMANVEAVPQEAPGRLARLGRGYMDVFQGTRQLLPERAGGYTDEQEANVTRDLNRYEAAAGDGMDWWRLGGQALGTAPLATIPGAAGGAAARTGGGALAGALGAGSLYEQNAMDRLGNATGGALFGGAFGLAMPSLVGALGKGGAMALEAGKRGLRGVETIARNTGILTNQADDVLARMQAAGAREGVPLESLQQSVRDRLMRDAQKSLEAGNLDEMALLRRARAEQAGFVGDAGPTLGQATRDPRMMGREYNLSRQDYGDDLAARFSAQRAVPESRFKGWLESVYGRGAKEVDPVAAGEAVMESAQKVAGEWQAAVRAMYDKVPGSVTLSTESLANRTTQLLRKYQGSVKEGVKNYIDDILSRENRVFTMDDWIDLDKLIGQQAGFDPAEQAAAGELKRAILGVLDDATDAAASDLKPLYTAARNAARQRFEAIGPEKELLAQFVSGRIAPDKLADKMVGGGAAVREIERLFNFIEEPAKRAIRARTLNKLIADSFSGEDFTQAGFNRALNRLGSRKLKIIFGDLADELKTFGKAAEDMFKQPQGSSANFSNSGNTLIDRAGMLFDQLIHEAPGGRLGSILLNRAQPVERLGRALEREALKGVTPQAPPISLVPNPAQQRMQMGLLELPSPVELTGAASLPFGLLGGNASQQ